MTTTESQGQYVPAIVIGGQATVEQRARNFAFYQRLKAELHRFQFERGGETFLLDPESDCYRRLVAAVVSLCDLKCDADDEVARLRGVLATELRDVERLEGEVARLNALLSAVPE